jgi:uncharacterized protein (DUF2141 family)
LAKKNLSHVWLFLFFDGMKTALRLNFFLLLFFICRQGAAQNRLEVSITNFENNKGVCRACIFNSEESFVAQKPLACVLSNVGNRTAQAVFTGVPDGTYALFVIHDANNNGKMDKNFLGIPKEGYGASKNKLPFAAAPKFEANKFTINGNTTLTIAIRLRNI